MPHPTKLPGMRFPTLRDAREWVVNKFQFDDVGSFGSHETFEDTFARWIYQHQDNFFNDLGEQDEDEIFNAFLEAHGENLKDWR